METVRLRPELPDLPARIAALPVDHRGYPVPWFVQWVDGQPDHRIMDGSKLMKAWTTKLCWICGQPLGGATVTFAIGPMCAVNRVSAEPPSHKECALFSVKGCPFLSRPHAHRREAGLPENHVEPSGNMLRRNPGVMLLWTAKRHTAGPFAVPDGGFLFNVGEPLECLFFFEGREATREEIEESINSGLPHLRELAEQGGLGDVAALEEMVAVAWTLLPVAA